MKSAWRVLIGLMILLSVGGFLLRSPGQRDDSRPEQRSATQRSTQGSNSARQDAQGGPGVFVSDPVTPTLSRPARNLPPATIVPHLDREINPRLNLNVDVFESENRGLPGGVDTLLARQQSAPQATDPAFLTPILNFDAQGYTFVNPPDTVGDVGLNHYIHMINDGDGALFKIYDKNGNVLAGPAFLDDLGSGQCSNGYGDPIVLYDPLADRWLMSEFAANGNHLCVYISQTADPTGAYYAYDFSTPNFPDYPKYAVWPDAYYVSSNENSPAVYALDRNRMLNGQSATFQRFTGPDLNGFGFQAYTPSDLDGATPPQAGAPNYFMRHRDDEVHNASPDPSQDFLEVWEFHVDWDNSANSTFTGPLNIPVSEFDSDLCGLTSFYCFPQQGSSTTLDPLREVIMWRLQYRNFGDYEVLVGNLVTDVDGTDHGGIRWFELRKSGSGDWSLYQEGTYAPDPASRWMGSSAMDGDGNIAVGYSVSSSSMYPSIRYAGRLLSDPLGTLPQEEGDIMSGTSSNGSNRWGDYSAMSLDPADDCTFWFTNMYSESGHWDTRVATFKFASCGTPGFALDVTPATLEVCEPEDALFDVTVGSEGGFADPVTLSTNGNPGTASFSVNPVTPPGASVLTISGAIAGSYTFDVIGTSGDLERSQPVQLDVVAVAPSVPALLTPPDGATDVPLQPQFTWSSAAGASDYIIEIATDEGFANVVDSATVPDATYMPATPLDPGTLHYWRVSAQNACGDALSQVSTFQTQAIVCAVYSSTDIPQQIPIFGTSTVESVLVVDAPGDVVDVNVLGLQGEHSRVGDLSFSLRSPVGTTVEIMEPACANEDDFDLNLDDEAGPGPWPCPPTDGGTYQPSNPLASFDGEEAGGTWTLGVTDTQPLGGGSLEAWSLEICAAACAAPGQVTGMAASVVDSDTVRLEWDAAAGATSYEVWRATDNPYFDPTGLDCANPAPYTCAETANTFYEALDLGNAGENYSYMLRALNTCGPGPIAAKAVGEFDYLLAPGE